MDPTRKESVGLGDRWIQAAHSNAMEGSTTAAKGDCLAALGAGILSAGGAMVRGLWHGLTGKVQERDMAHQESSQALDLVGKAVLGLLDAESLKTPEDHQNLSSMEALAPEIRTILSNSKVPDDTKTILGSWYRNAQTIVKKGLATDAAAEIKTLGAVVSQVMQGGKSLDIKAIRGDWLDKSKRQRIKATVVEDDLNNMAQALMSRHPLVASSPEGEMRGRVTVGDQNPNVPRPGNPPRPPSPPKPD